MSTIAEMRSRRAEFAAELFLDGLKPATLAKSESSRLPFDFVVTLKSPDRLLKMFQVEVKATEKLVGSNFHFLASIYQKDYLKNSGTPVIIIIVDVKRNKMYYGFSSRQKTVNSARRANLCEISVPVSELLDSKQFLGDLWKEVSTHSR